MPIQEAHVAGMKEGIKEALLAKEETMEGASLAEEEIMHSHRLPSRGEKYAEMVVAPHLKCFATAASLIREAYMYQLCIFFNTVQKGGWGGETHVQKFCCKYSIILKGFLAS